MQSGASACVHFAGACTNARSVNAKAITLLYRSWRKCSFDYINKHVVFGIIIRWTEGRIKNKHIIASKNKRNYICKLFEMDLRYWITRFAGLRRRYRTRKFVIQAKRWVAANKRGRDRFGIIIWNIVYRLRAECMLIKARPEKPKFRACRRHEYKVTNNRGITPLQSLRSNEFHAS